MAANHAFSNLFSAMPPVALRATGGHNHDGVSRKDSASFPTRHLRTQDKINVQRLRLDICRTGTVLYAFRARADVSGYKEPSGRFPAASSPTPPPFPFPMGRSATSPPLACGGPAKGKPAFPARVCFSPNAHPRSHASGAKKGLRGRGEDGRVEGEMEIKGQKSIAGRRTPTGGCRNGSAE